MRLHRKGGRTFGYRIDDELDELAAAWAEASQPDVLVARQGMMLDVGAH